MNTIVALRWVSAQTFAFLATCSLFVPASFAGDLSALDIKCASYLKSAATKIDREKTLHFPSDATPYEYEVELAKASGLSLEEIVAITRNFSEHLAYDGSTGVFWNGTELEIDATKNLIDAYRWGIENIVPGKITFEQIIELRRRALSEISVPPAYQRIAPTVDWNCCGKTSAINGFLAVDAIETLKKFGYRLTFTYDPPQTKIHYTVDRKRQKWNLDRFVDEINGRGGQTNASGLAYFGGAVGTSDSPYGIAKMIRDFIALHPFDNGNGRTGRLLGQILIQKAMNKAVWFPKEFHEELSHSLTDLESILDPMLGQSALQDYRSTFATEIERAKQAGAAVETAKIDGPKSEIGDSPFIKTFFSKGRPISYAKLPAHVKAKRYDKDLYFGKPYATENELENGIKMMFQYGRSNRGGAHWDLDRHVAGGPQGMLSGFFQTSMKMSIASQFALAPQPQGTAPYGVIYVIDGRGSEMLDIDAFYRYLSNDPDEIANSAAGGTSEGEVIFSKTLNHQRIRGAIIYEYPATPPNGLFTTTKIARIKKVLLNPFYTDPTTKK